MNRLPCKLGGLRLLRSFGAASKIIEGKLRRPAIAAAVGLALGAPIANAQTTITPTEGDLILGVRVITLYDTNNNALPAQGLAGTDLVADIGPITSYISPSPSHFTISGWSGADLTDAFGSNWNSRTDLAWGIVGNINRFDGTTINSVYFAKSTIFATTAESTPGTLSATPLVSKSASLQNTPIANNIEPLYTGTAPLNGGTSTTNSSITISVSSSASGSWTDCATPESNPGWFINGSPIENNTNIAAGGFAVSDLYQLTPTTRATAGTYLGSFGLGSDGSLQYSTDPSYFAVPEPSAIHFAIFGAGLLAAIAWRRRMRGATL